MTERKGLIIACAVLGLGLGSAQAETCTFTTECMDAGPCSETSFGIAIEDGALVNGAVRIPVAATTFDGTKVLTGEAKGFFHVLTRQSGGKARYTMHHLGNVFMVNYIGSCAP